MPSLFSLIARFNLVRQIPLFGKLNWFDVRRIARNAVIEEYQKGDIIRREGDPPDFLYCVISGRLQSYTQTTHGKKANVEFIHRGMHFGIISVLTGENHSLTYEAINDSVILKIAKDDFHGLLKAIPALGLELSQILSKRVRSHVKGSKSFFESTIISIYSPAKGSGSSTYAANLALSLEKETKKKVILLNIHTSQDQLETKAIELKDIALDHEKILQAVIKNELPIDILNVIFKASDISLKKKISPLVSTLMGDYHYLIVDLPNEMDDFVLEALTQSDEVHLVTLDKKEDLTLIRKVIDRLELTFKEKFQAEKIHIIVRAPQDKVYLSFEEISKAIDFNVYTMLPYIDPAQMKLEVHGSLQVYRCEENSSYAKAVRAIARQIGRVMVGLAFGGGAALGIAHIGVIRVLEEENIPIDMVAGSSMGAVIGALWTTGRNSHEIEKVAREFDNKAKLWKLFSPSFPIAGLMSGRSLKAWFKKHFSNTRFQDTIIPLKILAYDLIRREELILDSGFLVEALQKSTAIPGVIPPIQKRQQLIIDGGVLNPLPTNVLAGLGVKKIIAVNVLQSPEDVALGFDMAERRRREIAGISFFKSPFKFLLYRLKRMGGKLLHPNIPDIIVRTLQASEYVISQQCSQLADVLIHPNLVGISWFELYRIKELIERGEEAARQAMPQIKKLIEQ